MDQRFIDMKVQRGSTFEHSLRTNSQIKHDII